MKTKTLAVVAMSLVGATQISAQNQSLDPALPGAWSRVPSASLSSSSPNLIVQNHLRGIAMLSRTDGWTVGWANNPNGPPYAEITLIERWNGTQFVIVQSPNSPDPKNELYAVSATSATDVWAVGRSLNPCCFPSKTLIEHWNGSRWAIVPSPNPADGSNELYAVKAISPTNVWAAGFYGTQSGAPKTFVLRWDGSRWTQFSSPNPGSGAHELFAITATSPTDVWVGGLQGTSGGYDPLALHWNGSSWASYSVPTGPGSFVGESWNSLSAISSNDIWAVGYNMGGSTEPLIDHWDGRSWNYVYPAPYGYCNYTPLYSVSAVASNFVWAIGECAGAPLIMQWDGTQWNNIPADPHYVGVMRAVSGISTANAFAAGSIGLQTLAEEYSLP